MTVGSGSVAAETQPATDQTVLTSDPDIWSRQTLTGDWGGLRSALARRGITFGLQEQSEVWGNLVGGLHQGITYDGITTASIKVDLGKLLGIPNTTFFIDGYQIHGRGPTASLVGNLQVVSNPEATRETRLYDLWIETKFLHDRLSLRLGQEGANDEMMVTQYGALFLNSSFGYPPVPALDLPQGGPNYPLSAPFVRLKYDFAGGVSVLGAIYNDDPAPPGTGDPQRRDPSGSLFRLQDHALAFLELWYAPPGGSAALPTTYKIGAWFDTSRYADLYYDTAGRSLASPASNGQARQHQHDYAVYTVIDQALWHPPGAPDRGIGAFLQIVGAPGDRNLVSLFVEAGLNWKAPFTDRPNDIFGLAVAYQGISPAATRYSRDLVALGRGISPYSSNETAIEATYDFQVTPWWTLQPDLQYVINPGAGIPSATSSGPLRNDLIGGLRASVTF